MTSLLSWQTRLSAAKFYLTPRPRPQGDDDDDDDDDDHNDDDYVNSAGGLSYNKVQKRPVQCWERLCVVSLLHGIRCIPGAVIG